MPSSLLVCCMCGKKYYARRDSKTCGRTCKMRRVRLRKRQEENSGK